uniref:Phytase-like domain-containing protein n=1 Tax=Ramularia collo-cygni TaxID=112498 RepID=A0A2D3V1G7_9PEZI
MRFLQSFLAIVPLALSSLKPVYAAPQASSGSSASAVNTTTCNGKTYVYEELAGYGFIEDNAVDKLNDTVGGIGSSIAIDRLSWIRVGNSYQGILYAIPDRGWNTEGTLNYQSRIQKYAISFKPNPVATVENPSDPNLKFTYLDTILLTDPAGQPAVGLDGGLTGPYITYPGYSFEFPSANYTGDGFGGEGPGGFRLVIDAEGLVLGAGGTFWVSDEYGDYIYQFSHSGKMIGAIRPPDAFIPLRNNTVSFSSDNPPRYNPALVPTPVDPSTGRANNQGLEGLTTNPLRTKLYALTQSALIQDGGSRNRNSRNARLLVYDILSRPAKLEAEYVVQLNRINPAVATSNVARQSELHYISETQFLILARDSGAGRGQGVSTTSIYRHIDVFDISKATNVAGISDCTGCQIASTTGVLNSNTTAAQYCPWLDFNVNSQLNRFGVRNGGAQSDGLLNEKWESMALLPVNPLLLFSNDYYLLSFSDNDFITQDGQFQGGDFKYSDASGYSLSNQALLFKVKLPSGSFPLEG